MPSDKEIQNTLDVSKISYAIEQIIKKHPNLSHEELIEKIKDKLVEFVREFENMNLTFLDFHYDPKTGATIVAFKNKDGKIIIGVTGSQEIWKDWVKSNGTLLLTLGEVNIQVKELADFVRKMLEKYPESTFILTGHSLGGSGALILGYMFNIATITYNAAPVGNSILDLFAPPTYAINFISENDELNGLAKVLVSHKKYKNIWIKNGRGHSLDDLNTPWAIHAMSTILAVETGLLSKDLLIQLGIDLNGDGIDDVIVVRTPEQVTPFSLLSKQALNFNGNDGTVKITSESLRYLSASIKGIIDNDIWWITKNLVYSMESNTNIIGKKDTRVEDIIEKVNEQLKSFGIVNILNLIHITFDRLTPKTGEGQYHLNIFESLGVLTARNTIEQFQGIPKLVSLKHGGSNFDYSSIAQLITNIGNTSNEIYETLTRDHVMNGDEKLLFDVPIITASELAIFHESITSKVEKIFEGLGNRSNFNDGIAQGLEKLFKIQSDNIVQLESSLKILGDISEQLGVFFDTQDEEIAKAIASTSSPKIDAIPSFETKNVMLQESKEFADLSVISAKDEQIEVKGRELASYLVEILPLISQVDNRIYPYIDLMNKLNRYLNEFIGISHERIIAEVSEEYDEWKEITYMDWVDYEEKKEWRWVEQTRIKEIDFGTLSSIIGGHFAEMEVLVGATKTLITDFEELSARMNVFTTNYQQTNLHAERMIENAVYDAMGMGDVVNIQKLSVQVIERIILQFTHLVKSLEVENQGTAINTLLAIVQKNQGVLQFYQELIHKYFGDQI